jgi:hypothetical protein
VTAKATQRAIAIAAFVGAVLPAWTAVAGGTADACRGLVPKGRPLPAAAADIVAERVRGSALFSFPQFAVIEWGTRDKKAGEARSFLAFREGTAAPDVFAQMRVATASRSVLDWSMPAPEASADAAARHLAVVEHLYAFVLRQPPLMVFDLGAASAGKPAWRALPQPELLARLARLRNCATADLARQDPKLRMLAWEMPSISRPTATGSQAKALAARVSYTNAGRHAGTLTFARGDHLACSAPVQADGTAACRLFDSHGHEDHEDGLSAPTAVAYGGVVERDRIVLPMTRVDPAGKKSGQGPRRQAPR